MANRIRSNTKWLISRLKTSGSRRRYVANGSYADDRPQLKNQSPDNLPSFEGMGRTMKFYNGKINTSLLKRFLETKIGCDWDLVYDEIQLRIPTRLKEYNQVIYWYVADKIDLVDTNVFDRRAQKFINFEKAFINGTVHKEFIVSPFDNTLYRYKDFGEMLKAKSKLN